MNEEGNLIDATLRIEPHVQGSFIYFSDPRQRITVPESYSVWVTLAKPGDFRPFVPRPVNQVNRYTLFGDSNFVLDGPPIAIGIRAEGMPFAELQTHQNPESRLGCIQFSGFSAATPKEALLIGLRHFHHAMAGVILSTATPVNYKGALALSTPSGFWHAALRADFAPVRIGLANFRLPSPFLRFVGPSYIEGLRSPHPFYSLLCFFRIIETIRENRFRIRRALEDYGLPPDNQRFTLPEDSIGKFAPEYVGRRLFEVATEIEHEYRRYVAHLKAHDRFPAWTLEGEERFRVIALVMKESARILISHYDQKMQLLFAAGMSLQRMAEIFEYEGELPEPQQMPDAPPDFEPL